VAQYWVNTGAGTGGDHEVHKAGCGYMPQNRAYLGDFASCEPAVQRAKALGYSKANGCIHCSPACHVGK
jgi:hypothetical protein